MMLYLGQALVLISERENSRYYLIARYIFSILYNDDLCFI